MGDLAIIRERRGLPFVSQLCPRALTNNRICPLGVHAVVGGRHPELRGEKAAQRGRALSSPFSINYALKYVFRIPGPGA